jgi:leader peptidase (prepilin peptidase)/N-methyltransferase
MTVVLPTLVGVLGLSIGSFLNVVVFRVPNGLSVVRPASACPGCGAKIRARDNVPVLSWVALRGRCRACQEPISARYPIVETVTAAAFVAIALLVVPSILTAGTVSATAAATLTLVALLYLAAISVALSAIDLDVKRLPNAIVLPSYLVAAALLIPAAILDGRPEALVSLAVGSAGSFLFFAVLALIRPGGMGWGDVKLAGLLGLYLGFFGWGQLAVGIAAAFLLGGIAGIGLLLTRRATRSGALPFGPWMFAGTWIGIIAGAPLAAGYLGIFGLG